jgi:hypothetical protein
MAITYTIGEYIQSDSSVEVVYTNEDELEHRRHINIPKNPDGSIDEEYFAEVLEGQLRGVENKIRVGAVTFVDPIPEEPPTLEEEEEEEEV